MDLTDRCGSDGDRIEFLYSRSPIVAEFMVHDILDGSVRSSEICQRTGDSFWSHLVIGTSNCWSGILSAA